MLSLPREVLSTLLFLPIACEALLLFLLPIALTRIIVAITVAAIAAVSAVTIPIAFHLLATRGVWLLLLEPASLPVTVCSLSILLRTLFAFLRLSDLFLPLLCGTLSLLILPLNVATLFLRVLFACLGLSDLFLTLLGGTLPLLILTLSVATLFLRVLFPLPLLLLATILGLLRTLNRLFASALSLLRWAGSFPFLSAGRSRSLFLLRLVLLAPLLTSTTSPLSTAKAGDAR
jgi:hypothetical protein